MLVKQAIEIILDDVKTPLIYEIRHPLYCGETQQTVGGVIGQMTEP